MPDILTDDLYDGALKASPSGDLMFSEGVEATVRWVVRCAKSDKGTMVHREEYGMGLAQRVGELTSPSKISELSRDVRTSLLLNEDIKQVNTTVKSDPTGIVSIDVGIVTRSDDARTLTFRT